MKKTLLALALGLAAFTGAWAGTDGQTYEPVNGIKIANQWIFDRVHSGSAYTSNPICNTYARTATMIGDVVYVGRSNEKLAIVGTDSIDQCVIHRFSVKDGAYLGPLDLTLDGRPYGTFLGATSVARDDFGHLIIAPMTSNVVVKIPIYTVNTETGELTLVTEMQKGDAPQRTDYIDVMGDITGEKAECNIMTVAGSTADPGFATVYRWHLNQGETYWEGGFEGDPYIDFTSFYPETKTGFSLAPVIKMVYGEDEETYYSGELFYIDCFDGNPVLYSIDGTIIDTFEFVEDALRPKNAPNGMTEFTLDGRNFFVYVKSDMNGDSHGCQANICEMGEGLTFEGMTKYWQVPADSIGKVNDTGLRVHCFAVDKTVDAEGNEEVTLLTFKAYNGMAVYKIGKNVTTPDTDPEMPGDVNGDGKVDVDDVNTLINILLGKAPETPAANVDKQGGIDVQDVNTLTNILLGKV